MSGLVDHDNIPYPGAVPPPEGGAGIDGATSDVFQALGRVFHLHRQAMQRRLSKPEAHHGEAFSMRLLAHHDGMSQSDLADTLHLSRPRVTSILQGLEKAGAIRREADPIDQRVTRVFLTEEGRRREMENRAGFEEYVNGIIGRLSEDDKRQLARLLDEVSGNIALFMCPDNAEPKGRTLP
jgi:MarR family transcriptional regulator, organic hydroperoxide resistance regulator